MVSSQCYPLFVSILFHSWSTSSLSRSWSLATLAHLGSPASVSHFKFPTTLAHVGSLAAPLYSGPASTLYRLRSPVTHAHSWYATMFHLPRSAARTLPLLSAASLSLYQFASKLFLPGSVSRSFLLRSAAKLVHQGSLARLVNLNCELPEAIKDISELAVAPVAGR